jgi:hypothetical protein
VNRLRVALPAAAVVLACVGGAVAWLLLSADSAVAVSPPKVDAKTEAACTALHRRLPATVAGQPRERTSPDSPLTAAWGSSPIVLTCGIGEPSVLVPGSKDYDPNAQAVYANGVAWLPLPEPGGYAFVAIERSVYIEVFVPKAYYLAATNAPSMDAPTDLSPAVIAGTARNDGRAGADVSPP